jgi:hypothetical protein
MKQHKRLTETIQHKMETLTGGRLVRVTRPANKTHFSIVQKLHYSGAI